ncbi:hypothetical protein GCM10007063_18250 [Lentibacillus kapialis]|uniref:Uncharacterized protein n=1 Tax=Lentibacillus kapialis TaxID=340214 RepID=A0A917PX32_9BACI|nr:PD40 domain-containing protein [Lentibacillus kapialis]GGJ96140.1 hypothetical protein GCM10007063_18250 [Lentibacillus kapialis]
MSLKMKNISFISGMVLLFCILWITGSLAKAPEGFTGYGQDIDISPDDSELVFSHFRYGDATLYTVPVGGGKAKIVAEPEEGKSYINPAFSPDGELIAFIEKWETEERRYSQLRIFNRESQTVKQRINTNGYVTEAAFSPDGRSLYFLKADVFKNYSSITGKRPHEFDIFRMDLTSGETEQLTDKNAYTMSSLDVTPDGKKLLYRTNEGSDDRLVLRSIDNSHVKMIVPMGDFASNSLIMSSPALSPDGEKIVFTGVAAKDENGTFIYEAFKMDLETEQAEQLTTFHEHVANSIFFHNEDKLVVTVDKNFTGADADNSYWQISADGEEHKRVPIDIPEDNETE